MRGSKAGQVERHFSDHLFRQVRFKRAWRGKIELGHIEDLRCAARKRRAVVMGTRIMCLVVRQRTAADGIDLVRCHLSLNLLRPRFAREICLACLAVANAPRCPAAIARHRFRPGDAAGNGRTGSNADHRHKQGQQNSCGHAQRRSGHGHEHVDVTGNDQRFDQRCPDGKAAKAEQGAEPQRDNRGKQRMAADWCLTLSLGFVLRAQDRNPVLCVAVPCSHCPCAMAAERRKCLSGNSFW